MLQDGKSSNVIEKVVAAIKWKQSISGLVDTLGPLTKHMSECAKRVAKPKRMPKEPLTADILRRIFANINGLDAHLLDLRRFTILILSFAGFLRFDEVSQLKLDDVTFFSTHVALFLERC